MTFPPAPLTPCYVIDRFDTVQVSLITFSSMKLHEVGSGSCHGILVSFFTMASYFPRRRITLHRILETFLGAFFLGDPSTRRRIFILRLFDFDSHTRLSQMNRSPPSVARQIAIYLRTSSYMLQLTGVTISHKVRVLGQVQELVLVGSSNVHHNTGLCETTSSKL